MGEELLHGLRLGDISELPNISRPKAVQMIWEAQESRRAAAGPAGQETVPS